MMQVKKDGDFMHDRMLKGRFAAGERARAPIAPRSGLLALAALLVFGLSACGSKSSRVSDASTQAVATASAASPGRPSVRGGGYYKDDGPSDYIPDNIDAIPDAVPRIEPLHRPALRPYTVMGQSFVPMTELRPFSQRGHASWYGRRFHGNPTSIGEPYDMFAMTAAHPTLPIPSYVRVTNLANGRSVVVRVNDRGPFLRGRIIDLSYTAAHRLGYINSGSAHVEVETITHQDIQVAMARGITAVPGLGSGVQVAQGPANAVATATTPAMATPPALTNVSAAASTPPTQASMREPLDAVEVLASPAPLARAVVPHASAPDPIAQGSSAAAPLPVSSSLDGDQQQGAYLQLAAFSTPANAETLVERVRSELAVFADRLTLLDDGGRYRLQLGPFASVDDARIEAGRIGALLDLQPFVVLR